MPGTPIAKSHSLLSVNSFTWRGVINCSASPLRSSGLSGGISRGTSSPWSRSVGGRPTLRWRSEALRCTSCCSTALKLKPSVAAEPLGAAFVVVAGLAIRVDAEERLPVFHRLRVGGENLGHHAGNLGLDLVHDLHRLDDAEYLPLGDARTHRDVRFGARLGRRVVRPDHR